MERYQRKVVPLVTRVKVLVFENNCVTLGVLLGNRENNMDETTNIPTEEEVVEGGDSMPEMPDSEEGADVAEGSTQ